MPKATLKFDLPDEQGDFDAAILGREALAVLWDIDQRLRSLLKHGADRRAGKTCGRDSGNDSVSVIGEINGDA
jgi:hypothetical protein